MNFKFNIHPCKMENKIKKGGNVNRKNKENIELSGRNVIITRKGPPLSRNNYITFWGNLYHWSPYLGQPLDPELLCGGEEELEILLVHVHLPVVHEVEDSLDKT